MVRARRRCGLGVASLEDRLLMAADLSAPVTTAALVGTLGRNGIYTSPVTVEFSATDRDAPSSPLTTFASVNGGPFSAVHSVTLTRNGTDSVRFYSEDLSGRTEAIRSLSVTIDTTTPVVTAGASPSSLFPPNHRFVRVAVTGHVSDASGGVPGSVTYRVVDEYGRDQPRGTAPVDADGNYAFSVPLQSSRLGQDKDGRQYTIIVTATDEAGNVGRTSTSVVVLHDQGHVNGRGSDSNPGRSSDRGGPKRHPGNGSRNPARGRRHGHGRSAVIVGPVSAPIQVGNNGPSNGGEDRGDSQASGGNGHGHRNSGDDHGNGHGNSGGNGHGNSHGHGKG